MGAGGGGGGEEEEEQVNTLQLQHNRKQNVCINNLKLIKKMSTTTNTHQTVTLSE